MLPELTPATLLAIYGALLSTLLAVWTVRKDFRDRGRLTLRVDIETPIYISETGPERRPKKINFTVINRGRRACTLYRVGFVSRPTLYGEILRRMFRRNWKRRLAGTDTLAWQSFDGLPMRLEYEEFWTGSCDWKAIYMHPYGSRIAIYAEDTLGRCVFTKRYKVDQFKDPEFEDEAELSYEIVEDARADYYPPPHLRRGATSRLGSSNGS